MYLCIKREVFKLPFFIIFFLLFIQISNSDSSEFNKSTNNFGLPGIVDMPVSDNFRDGTLSFSSSKFGPHLRNTLSFQALPRVLASFRYSGIGDQKRLFYYSSGYTNWDRSFDLRINFLKENKLRPSMSLGLQDFIGTGNYSSEYLVASKTTFNSLRTTIGLGWGRLASRNVIGTVSERTTNRTLEGGILQTNYFKGDVGLFGGLEYKTPIKNLLLKYEISSDDYKYDRALLESQPTKFTNLSAQYLLSENVSANLFYMNESEIGFQLNVSATPSKTNFIDFLEPTPDPFYSIPFDHKEDLILITNKVKGDLINEKIEFIGNKFNKDDYTIVIDNYHYTTHTQAIGRTLRILSRHIPLSKKYFNIILSEYGIPIKKVRFDRREIEDIIDAPNAELLSRKIVQLQTAPKVVSDIIMNDEKYPSLDWSLTPYYRVHLFDPDRPVYYDFGPELNLSILPKPGIIFSSNLSTSVFTTFGDISRGPKGGLPNVRTQLKDYLIVTDNRIDNLYGASYSKITDNLYGRITAGYLENMYAGVSLEMMHSKKSSPVSYGIELNYVKPRGFRQLLDFREVNGMPDYNGHFSGYWQTGYYNYDAQIDFGKYLAGDKGGTFTLSRNFPNGWNIGGFFTLTDASFRTFGEGSFDKGIFFTIPYSSFSPYQTRSALYEKIRPVQGDGGQRLEVPGRLNGIINQYKINSLNNTWNRIWR